MTPSRVSEIAPILIEANSKVRVNKYSGPGTDPYATLIANAIRTWTDNENAARIYVGILYCNSAWLNGKYIRVRHQRNGGGSTTFGDRPWVYARIYDGKVDYTGNPATWSLLQTLIAYDNKDQYAYRVDEGQASFITADPWVSLVVYSADISLTYWTQFEFDYIEINNNAGGAGNLYTIDYDSATMAITWETAGPNAYGYLNNPSYP